MVLGVYLVSGLSESFAGLSPGLYLAALLVALHRAPAPLPAWHAGARTTAHDLTSPYYFISKTSTYSCVLLCQ